MKKNILYIALCITAAFLSYKVVGLELIWLIFGLASLLFLLPDWIISYFRKLSGRFFSLPLSIIGICLIGVFAALLRPYDDALLNSGTESEQLQYAYESDQNDRKQLKSYIPYLSKLRDRDDLRLNQAKMIYEKPEELGGMDKFYAAFIFHHSDNSSDYETASKLASEAAKEQHLKDHYQVQWLEKAAYDRWMVSTGKPEKYNTQNKFSIEID